MPLIDDVITVGEMAGVQCLQFVNDITHGAGAGFASASDLAALLASDARTESCSVLKLFRHSMGHLETDGER